MEEQKGIVISIKRCAEKGHTEVDLDCDVGDILASIYVLLDTLQKELNIPYNDLVENFKEIDTKIKGE